MKIMNTKPKYMYVACTRAVLLHVYSVYGAVQRVDDRRLKPGLGTTPLTLVQCLLVSASA